MQSGARSADSWRRVPLGGGTLTFPARGDKWPPGAWSSVRWGAWGTVSPSWRWLWARGGFVTLQPQLRPWLWRTWPCPHEDTCPTAPAAPWYVVPAPGSGLGLLHPSSQGQGGRRRPWGVAAPRPRSRPLASEALSGWPQGPQAGLWPEFSTRGLPHTSRPWPRFPVIGAAWPCGAPRLGPGDLRGSDPLPSARATCVVGVVQTRRKKRGKMRRAASATSYQMRSGEQTGLRDPEVSAEPPETGQTGAGRRQGHCRTAASRTHRCGRVPGPRLGQGAAGEAGPAGVGAPLGAHTVVSGKGPVVWGARGVSGRGVWESPRPGPGLPPTPCVCWVRSCSSPGPVTSVTSSSRVWCLALALALARLLDPQVSRFHQIWKRLGWLLGWILAPPPAHHLGAPRVTDVASARGGQSAASRSGALHVGSARRPRSPRRGRGLPPPEPQPASPGRLGLPSPCPSSVSTWSPAAPGSGPRSRSRVVSRPVLMGSCVPWSRVALPRVPSRPGHLRSDGRHHGPRPGGLDVPANVLGAVTWEPAGPLRSGRRGLVRGEGHVSRSHDEGQASRRQLRGHRSLQHPGGSFLVRRRWPRPCGRPVQPLLAQGAPRALPTCPRATRVQSSLRPPRGPLRKFPNQNGQRLALPGGKLETVLATLGPPRSRGRELSECRPRHGPRPLSRLARPAVGGHPGGLPLPRLVGDGGHTATQPLRVRPLQPPWGRGAADGQNVGARATSTT